MKNAPRSRTWRRLGIVLIFALAGCAGSAPTTFDLVAPTDTLGPRSSRGQLVVSEPAAPTAYDSERIVVRPRPTELAYLTGAQWSERLPALIQSRIIQTFENSAMLRSVGRPGEHIDAAVTLESDIRAFEIDVAKGVARVEISAKLVTDPAGKVIAAQVFSGQAPAKDSKGAEATAALNAALAQVLRQMVAWAAGRV